MSRPAALTGCERRYLAASSQPYLYQSAGMACLSNIEDTSADPGPAAAILAVPPGGAPSLST